MKIVVLLAAVFFQVAPTLAQQDVAATSNRQHLSHDAKLYAGPQLYGGEYRSLREDTYFDVLQFEIVKNDGAVRLQSVVLGPDFVIENGNDGPATVYDFRFRRIITLNNDPSSMTNESLFGHWSQRWAFLSNNLWTTSVIAAASVIKNPELERYWIEQKNGVEHPQEIAFQHLPVPELRQALTDDVASYHIGDELIAEAVFTENGFPSESHRKTFAAWLVWSRRLHPKLATQISLNNKFPRDLKIMVRNEPGPSGASPEVSKISFSGAIDRRDDFEVLAGKAPETPGWEPRFSPELAALMSAAARGEAPNGPVSKGEYIAQVEALAAEGRAFDTVLLAIHASFGCSDSASPTPFCDKMTNAIADFAEDENFVALMNALRLDQNGQHADGAKALIPLQALTLERKDILDVMFANMLVEAKNDDQLDDELQSHFDNLPMLFEAAFGRDPYAPSRYRDFYNYLFASTTTTDESYAVHTEAYPVADFARSIPERTVPKIVDEISKFEERIATDFAVHFPTFEE